MRRIKMMLAVVSAVATMLVMAAPAMAQDVTFTPAETSIGGDTFIDGIVTDDFGFGVPVLIDGDFDDVFDNGAGNAQFLIQDPNSSVGSISFS